MTDAAFQLRQALREVDALRQLKKNACPVAGIAITLLHAGREDSEQIEVIVSNNHVDTVLDAILADRIESVKYWVKANRTTIANSTQALQNLPKEFTS